MPNEHFDLRVAAVAGPAVVTLALVALGFYSSVVLLWGVALALALLAGAAGAFSSLEFARQYPGASTVALTLCAVVSGIGFLAALAVVVFGVVLLVSVGSEPPDSGQDWSGVVRVFGFLLMGLGVVAAVGLAFGASAAYRLAGLIDRREY